MTTHNNGEPHLPQCPAHNDNYGQHKCGYIPRDATIEHDDRWHYWELCLRGYISQFSPPSIHIDYCPWCGEELPSKPTWECKCAEIAASAREQAADARKEPRP